MKNNLFLSKVFTVLFLAGSSCTNLSLPAPKKDSYTAEFYCLSNDTVRIRVSSVNFNTSGDGEKVYKGKPLKFNPTKYGYYYVRVSVYHLPMSVFDTISVERVLRTNGDSGRTLEIILTKNHDYEDADFQY